MAILAAWTVACVPLGILVFNSGLVIFSGVLCMFANCFAVCIFQDSQPKPFTPWEPRWIICLGERLTRLGSSSRVLSSMSLRRSRSKP